MEERTINGKSISQVMTELTAPFPELKYNNYGYPYLEYETYKERMDTVVGVLNYDFIQHEKSFTKVGEKYHISVIGTLTIRDDAGNTVVTKGAIGGTDIILFSGTKEAVKISLDEKTAYDDAFKSCCRMLGVADKQIREARRKIESNATELQQGGPVEVYRVQVTGAFKSVRGGYKAPAVIVETGESIMLVFWKNAVEDVEKLIPFARFIEAYGSESQNSFRVYATRNIFTYKNNRKEEQLVVSKMYTGGEE